MKNLFKLTFSKAFFSAFFVLLILVVYCAISGNELIAKTVYPLYVPVFIIFFFLKYRLTNIAFISFLIFSFLADLSFMFFEGALYLKVSSTLYLISYLHLVAMALPKFKILKLDKIVGAYLVMVFCITMYFLFSIHNALKMLVFDSFEVLIFAVKSLVLTLLAFIAFGVYLSTQSKRSVIFLVSVIFFVFSTVLGYVNLYYLSHWSFVMLGNMLYVSGLYYMFKYMIFQNRSKKSIQQLKEKYVQENILA